MISVLAILAVIGLALGLWGEFSEQRRLGRMARACKNGKESHHVR